MLSEKQIKETYDNAKEDYLKTAIKINKTDLDAAVENADEKNEKIISDVIDPTPGLFVNDQLNLEDHFKYKSNVIERSFNVAKQLQQRLDNILETMIKNNWSPIEDLMQQPTEHITNNPLNNGKTNDIIKTEDIYIDDSLKDINFFSGSINSW